jgi:hypothetical protein
MSFQTIKDGIRSILRGLAYQESEQAFNFDNASSAEYRNTFILTCESGEFDPESDSIPGRVYDNQIWEIQIAFEKSSQSDIINLEEIHRAKDALIAALDNTANWLSYARVQRYKSWNLEAKESFYLLTIILGVTDIYTY